MVAFWVWGAKDSKLTQTHTRARTHTLTFEPHKRILHNISIKYVFEFKYKIQYIRQHFTHNIIINFVKLKQVIYT